MLGQDPQDDSLGSLGGGENNSFDSLGGPVNDSLDAPGDDSLGAPRDDSLGNLNQNDSLNNSLGGIQEPGILNKYLTQSSQ